ncbi:MAG: Asp-tRNA(Asn)/Glu-tRNA(Gln) amidotransferase subunit GatC [Syntrophales bacterium]|nr:Asp-tRNA(Asn)/Glu-tRNA(Gln) amidotransferase subunit GatC [Syntrophales bacterium]
MKITKNEVLYVAHLARLELTDEEVDRFTLQLNDILLYMEKLNSVDTSEIEPMSHAITLNNAFREDVVLPSISPELALANAPEAQGDFFRVPKVIE